MRGFVERGAILIALVTTCSLLVAGIARAADQRPNVVVILSDDQGWGDLSVHGNVNLHTPIIDSLARNGALFDRFFVCPVCSPTRAEFLTGRYHPRGGVWSTSTGGERLDLDETTIGDVFKAAGYATGAFGKWHNGMQYPYHPNARGFDEFYGFCSGHWGNYFSPILEHNGQLVRGKGFIIDDLTDHALEFIERNKDRPFFCYLPLNTPHSPMQVPDRFFDKFADAELTMRNRDPEREDVPKTRAALAMCENIDWNVGRVLKRLDDLQLADNTIVVYFSDNGPNSWRFNGGMKGRKGSTDEGGVRVPCLVRWPGHIEPGTKIPQIAGAIDLLPTLADMAGIPLENTRPLDGISVKALLLGTADGWPDRMIFTHWRGRVSVRTGRYRLDHTGQLFDMTDDPRQDRDIAMDKKEVAARLSNAAAQWEEGLLPGLTDDDRPFPVGYPDFPTTHLPARDGVPHGNVERSAKAPNCSYFTHWISTEDRITWDIEVATSGDYEAVVYYTCAQQNVGSTIELSFGASRIEAKVAESHDPPLRGAEHDRTPRGSESYVKDFKPLRLGVLPMQEGRGLLTLRALRVPGQQVMDVRYVRLALLKSATSNQLGSSVRTAEAARRPNIVWILAEDMGPDLGCYGVEAVKTPNLDALAAEGARFENAFTTAPVCSTSRSAMMTGMYQNAIGAHQHRTADKRALRKPVHPFPLLLQESGYHVGLMVGRKLDLNFQHVPKQLFPDGDWAEAGDKPFFIQMTFNNTHRTWHHYPENPVDPQQVVVPPYYPDTPLVRRDIANGLEEIQKLDALVGDVLRRLEDEGLAENTLVIFIGDNGLCQVRGKQFLYDAGTHVPLIMRWPGRIQPGTVNDDLVSALDVTATVLAAAGVGVPEWMHGRDLLDPRSPKRQYVFTARDKMDDTHDAMRACRDKRFKYILNLMPQRAYCQLNEYKERQYPVLALLNVMHMNGQLNEVQDRFMQPTKPKEELYDLVNDPFETHNLADQPEYATELERLREALAAWREEIGDEGVTEEFRRGGWPSTYPTRSLEEWEAKLEQWKQTLLGAEGGPLLRTDRPKKRQRSKNRR